MQLNALAPLLRSALGATPPHDTLWCDGERLTLLSDEICIQTECFDAWQGGVAGRPFLQFINACKDAEIEQRANGVRLKGSLGTLDLALVPIERFTPPVLGSGGTQFRITAQNAHLLEAMTSAVTGDSLQVVRPEMRGIALEPGGRCFALSLLLMAVAQLPEGPAFPVILLRSWVQALAQLMDAAGMDNVTVHATKTQVWAAADGVQILSPQPAVDKPFDLDAVINKASEGDDVDLTLNDLSERLGFLSTLGSTIEMGPEGINCGGSNATFSQGGRSLPMTVRVGIETLRRTLPLAPKLIRASESLLEFRGAALRMYTATERT